MPRLRQIGVGNLFREKRVRRPNIRKMRVKCAEKLTRTGNLIVEIWTPAGWSIAEYA